MVIKSAYDCVREFTPKKIQMVNGVGVRKGRILDKTEVFPDYEQTLVSHIREYVDSNDNVTLVGGGIGVSTVVAARQSYPDGLVSSYEASIQQFEVMEETVFINNVAEHVDLNHAAVGEVKELLGKAGEFETVPPAELPITDVLILDCEGSELSILDNTNLPKTVIVETHGYLGSKTEEVMEMLEMTHTKKRRDNMKPTKDVSVITYEQ